MPQWLSEALEKSNYFMPHGHCYLWLPGLLWLHVVSDALIGAAYLGISLFLYLLVRKIRLPFSWVFIAFGLFIGLCGLTHFMKIWTVWNPDYVADGLLKAATAIASVATAIGVLYVRPHVEAMVNAARLSDERRVRLEQAHEELESLYQQVRTLDAQRSRFVANVSHELRTPLALILGPVENMLGGDDIDEKHRGQLEGIKRNGKILLKQVNDLLDMAKIDAGKLHVHYARVNLSQIVQGIASHFDHLAEQRKIDYRVDTPCVLEADVDQNLFERILINLLSNAFKFTPVAGVIVVSLESNPTAMRLSVEDSGPGIAPTQRVAVFERFSQVDDVTTRSHGGTGLGLAIVRELSELHGGSATAGQSRLGGACLQIGLPLFAPAGTLLSEIQPGSSCDTGATLAGTLDMLEGAPVPAAAPPKPRADGLPVVLVVEDNPDMRDFIVNTLEADFQVISAPDGAAGLRQILAAPPDLVVSDVMMPAMSGEQLVEAMRLQEHLNSIPVLLLTARADEELRVNMLRNGAQDYLEKPFRPAELLARAANLVTLKRAGDVMRKALHSASLDVADLAQELAAKQSALMLASDQASVAAEAARRASQVKSMFLSMVSHELRTPLSTISMNVQMLERDPLLSTLATPSHARLQRVARAAGQMRDLIESLLEHVRVVSGRVALRVEAVDAGALLHEVVEAHRSITPPQLDLIIEAGPALPALSTDARLLRVILSNLISNAVKFTGQGVVKIGLSLDDGWHVFAVQDTGPGIAPADIERIFLPFEQLVSLEHKSKPGVGLGLSLVQRMVDELGGRISVTSVPGEGSIFVLRLRDVHTGDGAAHG